MSAIPPLRSMRSFVSASAVARAASTSILVLVLLAGARTARAQGPGGFQPELRVDGLAPHPDAAQLGAGLEIPFGWYTRLGLVVAGGAARDSGIVVGSGRADAIVRFLLDPFRESPWGLSLGGGVSVRYEPLRGWREYLAVVAELEGSSRGPILPALQVGIGGGARVGIVLRRAIPLRR